MSRGSLSAPRGLWVEHRPPLEISPRQRGSACLKRRKPTVAPGVVPKLTQASEPERDPVDGSGDGPWVIDDEVEKGGSWEVESDLRCSKYGQYRDKTRPRP